MTDPDDDTGPRPTPGTQRRTEALWRRWRNPWVGGAIAAATTLMLILGAALSPRSVAGASVVLHPRADGVTIAGQTEPVTTVYPAYENYQVSLDTYAEVRCLAVIERPSSLVWQWCVRNDASEDVPLTLDVPLRDGVRRGQEYTVGTNEQANGMIRFVLVGEAVRVTQSGVRS